MARWIVAVLAGLLGACFIWVAAPINMILLNNALVSDSYFPEIAVAVMLFLLLVINPLLKLISPRRLFIDEPQMALIFAMLLIACTIPTQGLLRTLPHSLARSTQECSRSKQLSEIHEDMQLPDSLFPDKIAYAAETPSSTYLLEKLPEGESIPWKAWIGPFFSWGALMAAVWAFMIGMAMIVYPQWRHNERLPFPLVLLQQNLIGGITPQNRIPAIFKDRIFWLGCGIVLFLYALNGISAFSGDKVPTFPLGWNLVSAFSEEPWRHLDYRIKSVPKLYFSILGIAYFMPNRIGFSIWITVLAYGIYQMLGVTYFPPHDYAVLANHRHGATLAVGLIVLFLGRRHWYKVAKTMFMKVKDDEARRNRLAGWLFSLGAIGITTWMVWTGIQPTWAVALLVCAFLSTLVIARIVAETGLPFVRITAIQSFWVVTLLPMKMLSGPAIYLAGFLSMIFSGGSRVSPAAMAVNAMGLDKKSTPRYQSRTALLLIALLLLGFGLCGAFHLKLSYNSSASLDGVRLQSTCWGSARMTQSQTQILAWSRGAHKPIQPSGIRQVIGGALLASGLMIGCLTVTGWPIHPIGMLMVGHYYANIGWASIFLGWLAKVLILRFGGASAYKRMRNLFIGLILGEVFAAVIWAIVPVILVLTGSDPTQTAKFVIVPG